MKAMIFDFDGTLADTIPICIESFKKTIKKVLNKDFSDDEIYTYFGPTEKGVLKRLLGDRWEEGYKDYLENYSALHVGDSQVFEGVFDLLEYLKEKEIKLAIVSGKGHESMEISLECTGLRQYFSHIITGSEQGAKKEEHIIEALEKLEVKYDEACYVGDTAYDMAVSNKIGIRSVGAGWSASSEIINLMNQKPHVVFTKVSLLKEYIEQGKF